MGAIKARREGTAYVYVHDDLQNAAFNLKLVIGAKLAADDPTGSPYSI